MLYLDNEKVTGWEAAIRGMRNPMNSWDMSDSVFADDYWFRFTDISIKSQYNFDPRCDYGDIGQQDLMLMKKLARGGSDHAKYRRMINVYIDITAPLYWWKEMDTYKVGTVRNSCSTMHKIAEKEFSRNDFSTDHLIIFDSDVSFEEGQVHGEPCHIVVATSDCAGSSMPFSPTGVLQLTIDMLNRCRDLYLATKDKKYWWQMIQLLPSSYMQSATLMLNYEVLSNIYASRRNHKLDEWHVFCDWIEKLPHAEGIIFPEKDKVGGGEPMDA